MAAAKKATKSAKRRGRRTYADTFTDKIAELTGADGGLVTNQNLRSALGWDEVRYKRIKEQLRREGLIILGRGQGGSVGLAAATSSEALKVFVSYSHADEKLKEAVVRHLRPLERMKLISNWHDRKLLAGTEWDGEINKQLEEADLVLLLVSIDFINSKYCYDIELDKALEKHASGECRVIPVILRGCLWQHTPFAKLQALPRDGKPVSSFADQDDALASVAEGVRLVAEEMIASRQ